MSWYFLFAKNAHLCTMDVVLETQYLNSEDFFKAKGTLFRIRENAASYFLFTSINAAKKDIGYLLLV